MYEHLIKRAGLSLNRIIYSNTRMVYEGFPNFQKQQFNWALSTESTTRAKSLSKDVSRPTTDQHLCLDFTSED